MASSPSCPACRSSRPDKCPEGCWCDCHKARTKGPGMKARDMVGALYRHFTPRYAVISEVTCSESEPTNGHPYCRERRCDVLLFRLDDRIAVEVKVNRADLLADVADPSKQAAWVALTHRAAYAVPTALLDLALERVPDSFGVLEVNDRGHVRYARRAPKRTTPAPAAIFGAKAKPLPVDPGPLPDRMLYTLLIRLAQAEAHAKGYGWSHDKDADEAELRAKVKRLERDLELAHAATAKANERAADWHNVAALSLPQVCSVCAAELRPTFSRHGTRWVHRDKDIEARCHEDRKQIAEAEARAKGQDAPRYVYVPPVEPAEPSTAEAEAG